MHPQCVYTQAQTYITNNLEITLKLTEILTYLKFPFILRNWVLSSTWGLPRTSSKNSTSGASNLGHKEPFFMKRGLNLSKTKNSGNPCLWDPGCIKNLQKLLGLEFQRRSSWVPEKVFLGILPERLPEGLLSWLYKAKVNKSDKKNKQSSRNKRKVPKKHLICF